MIEFVSDSKELLRPLLAGTLAYVFLLITLRVSGKRTLAQMNAFDFVVTVAFGSTLATIMLSKDVSVVQGWVALATLALLQFVVASITTRSDLFARAVRATPTRLVKDGELLDSAMREQRTSKESVLQAIRQQGYGSLDQVAAVILETNGKMSVIGQQKRGDGSTIPELSEP